MKIQYIIALVVLGLSAAGALTVYIPNNPFGLYQNQHRHIVYSMLGEERDDKWAFFKTSGVCFE